VTDREAAPGRPRVVVVGGGISGLTAAFQVLQQRKDVEVTVLEREGRVGGTATSDAVDGFLVDRGPNGFLTNVPDAYNLSLELGLQGELLPASEAAGKRFLYFSGALVPVPTGAGALLRSPLLSSRGKARMVLEPFLPAADPRREESVHGFAARRLGREFADVMVAPMVAGVSAGDARQSSLQALFPRMHRLEAEHGGLVRGMLAQQRARRAAKARGEAEGRVAGGPSGPGGRLTSFRHGGAGRLTQALAEALGGRVHVGVGVERIELGSGQGARIAARSRTDPREMRGAGRRFRVVTSARPGAGGGELPATLDADAVIVATPAYVAAELLRDVAPEAVAPLAAIPYAGIRVVALGFDRSAVARPLDGFGFLVPPGQGLRILGSLWTSTLFPPQAPEGTVLLRSLAGGMGDPGFLDLDEDAAIDVVRADLRTSLGVTAAPTMAHVVGWRRGIPQYTLGHLARVEAAADAVGAVPGLALTGNAYRGIGLNDCVRDARAVGREVAARLDPA
jgi:oxygen-dependent protoporphyrinogen oxidase